MSGDECPSARMLIFGLDLPYLLLHLLLLCLQLLDLCLQLLDLRS